MPKPIPDTEPILKGSVMRLLLILLLLQISARVSFGQLSGDFAPYDPKLEWTYKILTSDFPGNQSGDSLISIVRFINVVESDSGDVLTLHFAVSGIKWIQSSGATSIFCMLKLGDNYVVSCKVKA